MASHHWPNLATLNENAKAIADASWQDASRMEIVQTSSSGGTVLDFATNRSGTLAAGIELARICLAGLADVQIVSGQFSDLPLPSVQVTTDNPVEACMASQYAGWPISVDKYFAMGSGPARSLRGKEEVLDEYGLIHSGGPAVAVLETNELPDAAVVDAVAGDCGVASNEVTLCVARTASLPGCVQVAARSVEVALHKLHELKFDLMTVKKAVGVAPLPPIANDDLTALGWTNDAILYGGEVNLWVDANDSAIASISEQVPSCSSADFGKQFLDLFKRYDMDFYKMDKLLFSPAVVTINNLRTGNVFSAGEVRSDILKLSFGME